MNILATAAAAGGVSPLVYAGFTAVVLVLLALDLGVFHRRAAAPGMAASIGWTAVWVGVALCFGGVVVFLYDANIMGLGTAVPVVGAAGETMQLGGLEALKLYLTAYLVEKSLSMDNVFVIAMIFASLGIPASQQHRVLFWGIVGALAMRGAMIGAGAAVIAEFSWVIYLFGAVLIVAAVRMALAKEQHGADPGKSWAVRLLKRIMPVSDQLEGQRLIARIGGRWHATPLLVALIVIEATDLTFAVDSIPAVFAITDDPFLIFTSNIMAILGLRSLYFCLASAMGRFRYLRAALVAVLLFVGVKLFLMHTSWKIPAEVSLSVVLGLLASGVGASLIAERSGGAAGAWRRARGVWRGNRSLRRLCVLTAGSLVILTGLLLSPLPGPQLSILGPLGLGLLASEFLWARRLATHAARHERGLRGVVDQVFARVSRLWIVPVVAWFWVSAWLLSEATPAPWLVWSLAFPAFTPVAYVIFRWYHTRRRRRAAQLGAPHSYPSSKRSSSSSPW